MDILIQNTSLVITDQGILEHQDILIRGSVISSIHPHDATATPSPGTRVLSGIGQLAMAGLKNAHTHAAMTLLRGFGDDMPLHQWLHERIWPAEAVLKEDDIYWGTRLAIIEMIRSGTTFANDMYFNAPTVMQAFEDGGIRAAVGLAMFDFNDPQKRAQTQKETEQVLNKVSLDPGRRVFPTIAPHSIYTCSGELLQWAAERSSELDLIYHIHMSETQREMEDCKATHGLTPFLYLESLGVMARTQGNMIAAHTIWIDPSEFELLKRYGVTVVHNPGSNMKLASGAFPWQEFSRSGIPIMIAPDGVASNNNLDMFEEMKLAALLQKHHWQDPAAAPAKAVLAAGMGVGATIFEHWSVEGHIRKDGPADLILLDLDHPQLVPQHNIASNLVYSANGSVVRTTICDGEILMHDRMIRDERDVLTRARHQAASLAARAVH